MPELGLPFGGFAVLFECGWIEGFSHAQASWWLSPTPVVDQTLSDYEFRGLGTLFEEFEKQKFAKTFRLAHRPFRVVNGGRPSC